MKKQQISNIISLGVGAAAILFLAVFYVYAFEPPTTAPPGCPSGSPGCDPPIHAGDGNHITAGNLAVNAGGGWVTGLIVTGYAQLDLTTGVPPATHCDASSEYGRMKFDSSTGLLYICRAGGWIAK
jgi:hypothetical protein